MNDQIRALEKEIGGLKKKLAEARRSAKPEKVSDYTLAAWDGKRVKLSELFGSKRDLIVIHNMGRKCVYCTLWADGINGLHEHLSDRAAFVVCSPDEPAVQKEFAAGRAWRFRMVSGAGSTFIKDMGFEPKPGEPWPGVSAFHKNDDSTIERTGTANFGPGDDFCAVWPLLDLLAGGPAGWEPKYSYKGVQVGVDKKKQ